MRINWIVVMFMVITALAWQGVFFLLGLNAVLGFAISLILCSVIGFSLGVVKVK